MTGDTLSPEIGAFLEQTRGPNLNTPFAPEAVRRVVQRVLAGNG